MFYRNFKEINNILKRKSIFFLGLRQTGKSTYLEASYPKSLYINLLKASEYIELLNNPENLISRIEYQLKTQKNEIEIVIIDEIQRIPELLNEVHYIIEKYKNVRFILTGSSPRKLKRSGANMLGGRAALFKVHPITWQELKSEEKRDFNWQDLLLTGCLPSILNSDAPMDDLTSYVVTYLKEEIEEESLSRNLDGFSRFLQFAAHSIGEQINYTSLASEAQLSPVTVKQYFEILNDTYLGNIINPFHKTIKRKAMMAARFYFFDNGIINAILKRKSLVPNSIEWGHLLENYIHNEIKAYLDYNKVDKSIQYWRSTSKLEIDFIIWDEINTDDIIAIEIKSTKTPTKKLLTPIKALREEFPKIKSYIVCQTNAPMLWEDGTEVLPIEYFLNQLWDKKIL
jgi:uncharacterized protein